VTQNGNELTYDPDGKFESLALGQMAFDSFDYTIDDLAGETSSATVTVKINGVNDAPDDPDPNDLTQHDDTLVDDILNPPQSAGYEDDDGELTFRSIVTDIDNGDTVRLEIEVKPIGDAFDETNTLLSSFVSSGSLAEITSTFEDDAYHWRARAEDQHGALSDWVSFGDNPDGETDFSVSTFVELLASDGVNFDDFGRNLSINDNGDTVIVGAHFHDDNGTNSGAVYIYKLSGGVWSEQQKITASDGVAFDFFGDSVSIDLAGDTVIVGASREDDGAPNGGAAYIYQLSAGVWTQQQKITASDAGSSDFFGASVSMDNGGDTVIVGSSNGDGIVANTGAAYVYQLSAGVWTQQAKLTASDGAASDGLGSVSLDGVGDTAIAGAFRGDGIVADSGAAYIFQLSAGVWTQQAKLTASDGALNDLFGLSVSMDSAGDTVIIGAISDDDNGFSSGSAYIFQLSAGVWTQQAKLTASDAAAADFFGGSVSISGDGDTVIVGAFSDDNENGGGAGAAYVYQFDGTNWNETKKVISPDGSSADGFGGGGGNGVSLDANGGIGAIGAPNHDHDASVFDGSAYVFDDLLI